MTSGPRTNHQSELSSLLADHLQRVCAAPYSQLVAKIDETRRAHDCLEAGFGTLKDGTRYFIEINVFWDDQPGGDLRVIGDISIEQLRRPWWKFWHTPDLVNSLIVRPDGTQVQ